jgi:hypothetical protein
MAQSRRKLNVMTRTHIPTFYGRRAACTAFPFPPFPFPLGLSFVIRFSSFRLLRPSVQSAVTPIRATTTETRIVCCKTYHDLRENADFAPRIEFFSAHPAITRIATPSPVIPSDNALPKYPNAKFKNPRAWRYLLSVGAFERRKTYGNHAQPANFAQPWPPTSDVSATPLRASPDTAPGQPLHR